MVKVMDRDIQLPLKQMENAATYVLVEHYRQNHAVLGKGEGLGAFTDFLPGHPHPMGIENPKDCLPAYFACASHQGIACKYWIPWNGNRFGSVESNRLKFRIR